MTETTQRGPEDREDPTHERTIDWNRFWEDADEQAREQATPSSYVARGLLADFFEEKGVPDSVADVGCGTGHVAFGVAERNPETDVVGYDAAEPILEENRERARREGVENVRFESAVLPEFDPGREFDVVFCYGTLCYVADPVRAVRDLYDAVAPGGHLVVGYSNELCRSHRDEVLADLREDDPAEAEAYARRYELLLEGESVLSYDRIHDAVGTWPRSFWEFTDRPDQRWAWRHVPMVWVPG